MFAKLAVHTDDGKALDKLYIPTRYPNGLPDIIPSMAYSSGDADEAIRRSQAIIETVKVVLGIKD